MRNHTLCFLLLFAGASACSGGGESNPATGFLTIEATDSPFDHSLVEHAWIHIDKIRLHSQGDAESGFTTVYEGAPIVIDLLDLRNGATRFFTQAELPVGNYRQVRIHLTGAELELTNGTVYSTDDQTLRLSSQNTSGFKVFIDPPVRVVEDENRTLLLDFDLTKTFKPVPKSDPLNADFFHLHPVIRGTNTEISGDIDGVVTTDDVSGPVPIERAAVYVLPPGEIDTELAIASTATESDGSYALIGLEQGHYDVLAVHGTLQAGVESVMVTQGAISTVDLHLE